MDKLFSSNLEDTEVYDITAVETENLRDNPPEGLKHGKNLSEAKNII